MVLRGELENPSEALASALRVADELELTPVVPSAQAVARPLVLPQRRLTAAQVDEVVEAFQAGVRAKELAARYGVSRQTVAKHLRRRGVATVDRLNDDETERAIRLYGQGWSLVRIGDKLGRDHSSICNVLKRAGIERRDSHGRPR